MWRPARSSAKRSTPTVGIAVVDPIGVHVGDARVRVEPALLPFGVFEAVELDHALADADRAEAADPPRIAQQFALDTETLLAVLVDDKPRPALAERRVHSDPTG